MSVGPANYRSPFKVQPLFRERIWGRGDLAPFFPSAPASDTKRIGEAWFTSEENLTESGKTLGEILHAHPEMLGSAADPEHPFICPLLLKLIFTTERLSVQVHPDDAYAKLHHGTLGKTEAWYVVDAEPDAEIAVGLNQPVQGDQFREAIRTGHIEKLLAWHKVKPGDTVLVPAGTVHAIGAGIIVCEVQENSDITYRLWDYGRPRELHIDHGAAVARREPYKFQPQATPLDAERDELTHSMYFRMERLRPRTCIHIPAELPYYLLLMSVHGAQAGTFWFVPAGSDEFVIEDSGAEWVLAYKAYAPLKRLVIE
ncbi:MAG TPA: type I phosphomannose isomerase catalytic subunit [Bryobacteraceae bacterium]|nr:type I phosphomannose isomerase catalytic subunit [Bryobacteraceae bacterium]